jgi:hypothetical protein
MKKNVFKKLIKQDQGNKSLELVSTICKENKINFSAISGNDHIIFDISYNQLLSIAKFLHNVIDAHYQEYESTIVSEKTQEIYIDEDSVSW